MGHGAADRGGKGEGHGGRDGEVAEHHLPPLVGDRVPDEDEGHRDHGTGAGSGQEPRGHELSRRRRERRQDREEGKADSRDPDHGDAAQTIRERAVEELTGAVGDGVACHGQPHDARGRAEGRRDGGQDRGEDPHVDGDQKRQGEQKRKRTHGATRVLSARSGAARPAALPADGRQYCGVAPECQGRSSGKARTRHRRRPNGP